MEQNKSKFKEQIEDNLEVNLNQTVEERWGQLKKAIKESAINNIGFKSNSAPRKPWITNEMTMKMKERGQ